jgi:hypothetical protein
MPIPREQSHSTPLSKRRNTAHTILLTLAAALLSACGGGGSGEPPTSFNLPPPLGSSAIEIPLANPSTPPCAEDQVLINAAGDLTMFWCDTVNGVPQLMAGRSRHGSATLTDVVTVEADFLFDPAARTKYSVLALNADRFLVDYLWVSPSSEPAPARHARVVDFTAGSPAEVGSAVSLPEALVFDPAWVIDSLGQLHAVASRPQALPLPSQIDLGRDVSAKLVQLDAALAATYRGSQRFFGQPSIDARALWINHSGSSLPHEPYYVASLDLTTGRLFEPEPALMAPLTQGLPFCHMGTPLVAWHSSVQAAIAWSHVPGYRLPCEWYVNGERLTVPGRHAQSFTLAGSRDGVTAVWFETVDQAPSSRLVWRHKTGIAGQWTEMAVAYPPADQPSPMPFLNGAGIVAGPSGTIAAPLALCAPIDANSCLSMGWAVSKFSGSAWTTRVLTDDVTATVQLAINASGKAVALIGTSSGERFRLRAYRF